MLEMLRTLIDYTYWAHSHVIASAATLSHADYMQPHGYSIGSVHAQLVHTMNAENTWLTRLQDQPATPAFDPVDFADLDAVKSRWAQVEAALRGYVAALSAADLNREIAYHKSDGTAYRQGVGSILMHVVNHGTDHRAQTLALLHQRGAATRAQDLIFYLREKATPHI